MKQRLYYLIAALLTGGILVAAPAVVLAESSNSGSDSTSGSSSSSSTSGTETETENETVKTETESHTLADRVAKFKTQFKVELGAADQARIKQHCVPAQGVIGKLNDNFGNSVTVRTKAYAELQSRLNKLVTNLKAKNVDTTTLEQEITALNGKISTYGTDLTAYKQSLTDLKAINCTTDPNGFQAALLAARSAHDKVVADALAVRTYMVDTIKPTLQVILKTVETSTNSTSGSKQ